MWRTDTLWFDVAIVMTIFAIGNVLFGRFEDHKPRVRRVLKVILVTAVTVGIAQAAGRIWAYGLLVVPLTAAAWVHLVWLPQNGINGWTAEPRDKYLELVRARKQR